MGSSPRLTQKNDGIMDDHGLQGKGFPDNSFLSQLESLCPSLYSSLGPSELEYLANVESSFIGRNDKEDISPLGVNVGITLASNKNVFVGYVDGGGSVNPLSENVVVREVGIPLDRDSKMELSNGSSHILQFGVGNPKRNLISGSGIPRKMDCVGSNFSSPFSNGLRDKIVITSAGHSISNPMLVDVTPLGSVDDVLNKNGSGSNHLPLSYKVILTKTLLTMYTDK